MNRCRRRPVAVEKFDVDSTAAVFWFVTAEEPLKNPISMLQMCWFWEGAVVNLKLASEKACDTRPKELKGTHRPLCQTNCKALGDHGRRKVELRPSNGEGLLDVAMFG
jgi:hypothetical protein